LAVDIDGIHVAEVKIINLVDRGDQRGSSFAPPPESIAFLTAVRDFHFTTLRPGNVRGNHYHVRKKEIIVVISPGPWELYWDTGIGTPPHTQCFRNPGAVLLQIEPLAAHAIKNVGTMDLTILACAEQPYDDQDPDTHPRQLGG
jgi:dTDP-4-dehydrorhamnose 3,5-epimerase-like enzyme